MLTYGLAKCETGETLCLILAFNGNADSYHARHIKCLRVERGQERKTGGRKQGKGDTSEGGPMSHVTEPGEFKWPLKRLAGINCLRATDGAPTATANRACQVSRELQNT